MQAGHRAPLQGREWMKPLKDACGPKLMAPKFQRKKPPLEGDMWFAIVYGVLCLAVLFLVFSRIKLSDQACCEFGLACGGTPMDTAETQVQFAGDTPTAKPGDIPDLPMPPQKIVEAVLDGLEKSPPEAFDPRLQYKKQFRELCQDPGGVAKSLLECMLS